MQNPEGIKKTTTLHINTTNENLKKQLLSYLAKKPELKEGADYFIKDTSIELNLAMQDPNFNDKQPKEIFITCADMPGLRTVINDLPTEIQLDLIEEDPTLYKGINNPSEEFSLKAIKRNFRVIDYIDYPSDELQVAALMQSDKAIYPVMHNGRKDYKLGPKASQLRDIRMGAWKHMDDIENPCAEAIELAAQIKKSREEDREREEKAKQQQQQQLMEEYERARQGNLKYYERAREETIRKLENIEASIRKKEEEKPKAIKYYEKLSKMEAIGHLQRLKQQTILKLESIEAHIASIKNNKKKSD